ncbi:hypothetical protein CspeluHIS016_0700430 [Cutaneotrichosporon spelunceum]|uniref:Uncharacterized protein n=1 Tax=Cutaneotrichosporon spelunceum TaxID=1672016 RepID=A0AAD3TYC9_9TREE|nr:hypothetical protein CspeluHIS016_0700430 [Cutaneotrichosporon spelunceum]
MHLPPWLAASMAALNAATHSRTSGTDDTLEPVYMATDGGLFMTVDADEGEGAVARLVKASNKPPTAWVWSPHKEARPDHVRIMVAGSEPVLCLAAPVDANGTPKAGDLHLVPCSGKVGADADTDALAGGASKDPARWTMTDEPDSTVSFHLPRGLFVGYSGRSVGASIDYAWSSGWKGMAVERLE